MYNKDWIFFSIGKRLIGQPSLWMTSRWIHLDPGKHLSAWQQSCDSEQIWNRNPPAPEIIKHKLMAGCIGPVVARLTADGPRFESYPSLTWIYLNTRNESPRLNSTKVWIGSLSGRCLCQFAISGSRLLAAHKTGSETVSPGRPKCVAKWPVEINVKGWLNGWIAEICPTKTSN